MGIARTKAIIEKLRDISKELAEIEVTYPQGHHTAENLSYTGALIDESIDSLEECLKDDMVDPHRH